MGGLFEVEIAFLSRPLPPRSKSYLNDFDEEKSLPRWDRGISSKVTGGAPVPGPVPPRGLFPASDHLTTAVTRSTSKAR